MTTEPAAKTEAAGQGTTPGGDLFRAAFIAEPIAVRDALRGAVARFARRITTEDAGALELALAEVLNNVAEHAYAEMQPGPVALYLRRAGGDLHCVIEDRGRPMPGLALPERQLRTVATTIDDLAEGGWGWALIRDLTADLAYSRKDGRNRLTFRIPLTAR
ncbi:ATP-binding protein [Defluviimonas sp. SAOS-178_SWC]|uniref:ATP-binding protein n=1 Tax=Defluviimonas sp. SAOS-178_SWC TaxID=3121287 RepID=UPI0032215172